MIIGLTGLKGTGKSEIANYLSQRNNVSVIHMGAYLREKYKDYLNTFQSIEEYAETFREYSIGHCMEKELLEYQAQEKVIVIDSLRTLADYRFFSRYDNNFVLIMVIANKQNRRKRICIRRRTDDCYSEEELQDHDFWEMSFGISKLMPLTDYFIINDGNIYELMKNVNLCLLKIQEENDAGIENMCDFKM